MSLFKKRGIPRSEQPRQRPTTGPKTPSGASTAYEPPEAPLGPAPGALPPGTRLPPAELAEARRVLEEGRAFAPHCDARILHEPGECWACDLYPDWQALRKLWGIAFTGHRPEVERLTIDGAPVGHERRELPCPADYNRPPDSPSDHRQWPNNRAEGERG